MIRSRKTYKHTQTERCRSGRITVQKYWMLLGIILVSLHSIYGRNSYTINESWKFIREDVKGAELPGFDDSSWHRVSIPHTWNNQDALDDEPGFYRGVGWYRKNIFIGNEATDKQIHIWFEGANQVAEVWINGHYVGKHIGGYTRFSFDITEYVKSGDYNHFSVRVDNSHNPDIPPLSADFTFFGGIYRDVYLKFTGKAHISLSDYASSGVYITTPNVSKEQADVNIRTLVENKSGTRKRIRIEQEILNPEGSVVAARKSRVNVQPGSRYEHIDKAIIIREPNLWCTEHPNLYAVYTRLFDDRTNQLLDEVHNPMGLRWFEFHPKKGFFLNGKHVKLIGTNRHQCYEGKGNALRDEMHVRDVLLLKEMGGNFLRVSHYPQDPVVMEMCDKLGIVTSVEIPVVNAITESEGFTHNSLEMVKEMIRQDFNRPSILIWNYMNEIMLRPPYNNGTEDYQTYCRAVGEYGRVIEETIRREDPSRYTMLVFHGNLSAYEEAGLVELPMLIGWNLYQGWYGGTFDGFNRFLDDFHDKYPDIPVFVSEYGADVDPRLYSFHPERFDFTAEYGNLYHEHYLKAIMDRTYVSGANIWNLNDFHSEYRGDSMPHINNKGITTLTRELKDTYLLYQAHLLNRPFLAIGGQGWKYRGGVTDNNGVTIQPLKIYSNAERIEVVHNSVSLGFFDVTDKVAIVNIPFVNGPNVIEATIEANGRTIRDLYRSMFKQIPGNLRDTESPFTEINVMLGTKRYFEDKDAGLVFIPEQPYREGAWGYIGGKPNLPRTRFGVLPAWETNILGTEQDPIYQTQRVGIEEFRLDVPDGRYAVYLYWAELEAGPDREALAYNLGQDVIREGIDERIFNIFINENKVLDQFNIAEQAGVERAVIKEFNVNVRNNEGLKIQFEPVSGSPILNAIRVYKMY